MSILLVLFISPSFHGCGCPLEPTSFWLAAIRHPCLSLGSGTRLHFPPFPFGLGFTRFVKSAIRLPPFSPTILFSLLTRRLSWLSNLCRRAICPILTAHSRALYRVLIRFSVDSHFLWLLGVCRLSAYSPIYPLTGLSILGTETIPFTNSFSVCILIISNFFNKVKFLI